MGYSKEGYEALCLAVIKITALSYEATLTQFRRKPTRVLRAHLRDEEGALEFYCPLVDLNSEYFIEKLRKRAGVNEQQVDWQ